MSEKTMNTAAGKGVLCLGLVCLDIVARPIDGDAAGWKEKQRIESISLLVGGDAANQAVHLASMGFHAMMNGCLGADSNGETVRATLKDRGVDTSLIRMKEGVPTGTSLLLISSQGERRIFAVGGAHSTYSGEDLPEELPQDCAALSVASLFGLPPAERDGFEQLFQKAKAKGIPVFADMDTARVIPFGDPEAERVHKLLPYIDYLLPSSYDILPMTGKETLEEAVAWLQERGVGHIIVKQGEKGASIFAKDRAGLPPVKIPAVKVNPVDTTGAGDCMSAAFVARILLGDDLESAVRFACAAGSYSTLFPGANGAHVTEEAVRKFMEGR